MQLFVECFSCTSAIKIFTFKFFCCHIFVLLGFAAFGQGKVAPFGQNMTAPGITNNPFLVS